MSRCKKCFVNFSWPINYILTKELPKSNITYVYLLDFIDGSVTSLCPGLFGRTVSWLVGLSNLHKKKPEVALPFV